VAPPPITTISQILFRFKFRMLLSLFIKNQNQAIKVQN